MFGIEPVQRTRGARAALSAGVIVILFGAAPARSADDNAEPPMRGVVRSINQAALSTEIPLRILKLPFREGERFQAGAVLVEFDCRRQRAELAAARGSAREAAINVTASVKLDSYKAIGRNDVEIAHARLEKAESELKSLAARVEDCIVLAPFSGRISEQPLRPLEFTTPQRPYLAIIDDLNTEIEFIAPSNALAQLKLGMPISFSVDELSKAHVQASVSAIGASVDPVSKTVKVMATVKLPAPGLAVGMSGTAIVPASGVRLR